jgi:putative solute:sodium symporter small subunit
MLSSPREVESAGWKVSAMSQAGRNERWRDTMRLALVVIVVLAIVVMFFVSLVAPRGTPGYPLGLVVAVIGLPLAGVLLVFWFAARQENIDQRHGLYED